MTLFATRADLLLLDEPTSGLDPLMEVEFRRCVLEAKERDQTVFLSSHILSEVEATCDRIGILRDGRLVDEGTLDQLRHLPGGVSQADAHAMRARIDRRGAPFDERHIVDLDDGSVAPLLAALSLHPIVVLNSRPPSLEEIFLHHYDGTE